jgi:hypothetical protein
MDRVILDTDVFSLSLKRRLPSPVLARLIGKQPCITFVTLGELTQWAELRQWGRRNRDALENWLGGVIVLLYSEDVNCTGYEQCPARNSQASPEVLDELVFLARVTRIELALSAWESHRSPPLGSLTSQGRAPPLSETDPSLPWLIAR